jgi:hypothetical protein
VDRSRLAKQLTRALAAALFATQFAWLGLAFRGASVWIRDPSAVLTAVESVLVWSFALAVATTRARRIVVASVAALLVVVQAYVFRYYHAPLDVQVAASALHAWSDVRPILVRGLPSLAAVLACALALEYGLATLAGQGLGRPRLLGVAAAAGLWLVPMRSATPDLSGVHALAALAERPDVHASSPGAAASLPPLPTDRAELPSVLFVLSESVRAEDYGAETAPETAAATPTRVDLAEMRSIASYTAVSFSAIFRGLTQLGAREPIWRAPSLVDFARAARDADGRRPTVIYASAQSEEVFEPKEMRRAIDRFSTSETLLGHGPDVADPREETGGVDGLVADRLVSDLAATSGPALAVLHLMDTHAPYAVDPDHAPFQPAEHVVAWSHMGTLHNAYKDAILEQDRAVAKVVRAFTARPGPWLVVFTSDHGEAFGEHGAIHHGQNLFDEQVHVPGWIAAGRGTLDDAQARALADHAGRFVTHLDLLPTVLDALGLWDDFAIAKYRAAMPGKSLLRPWEPRAPIPVTNCTLMFPCPTNTWGLFDGDHKLLARIYDAGWTCLVVGGGPERFAGPADPSCARLVEASRAPFPLLPNGTPNR